MHFARLTAALFAALVAGPALAQDEEGDALDDILGEKPSESVADEKKAVLEGDLDDRPGTGTQAAVTLPDEDRRRIIKTLQRKDFLKIGRFEASPHLGFVTNDPFINRYLAGAGLAYHVTEIFAIEFDGSYSPTFGEADYKPVTEQLLTNNQVSPDISRLNFYGTFNFQFSPIYGKVAVGGRDIIKFDVFGAFGTGVASTRDDLVALDAETEDSAIATEAQNHLTTNFGGGFRIIFSEAFALRLEGRSLLYIETLDSATLEMKQPFMLLASASFFFPEMPENL